MKSKLKDSVSSAVTIALSSLIIELVHKGINIIRGKK